MMTVKEEAYKLIESLPDSCTWDDVFYRFYVRRGVEAGLRDIEEGRVVSQDQVKREIETWFKSSGAKQPSPTFEPSTTTSPTIRQ